MVSLPLARIKRSGPLCGATFLCLSLLVPANLLGQQPSLTKYPDAVYAEARQALAGEDGGLQPKAGEFAKLHHDLVLAHFAERDARDRGRGFAAPNGLMRIAGRRVLVDVVANTGAAAEVREHIRVEGGTTTGSVGRVVSAWYPIARLASLARLEHVVSARPSYYMTRTGSITSQGDAAQRTDLARTMFGVDGTGATVGVMSDSYDCLNGEAADISSGDLPNDVVNLEELSNCALGSDEARAMAQIVHDVAPGADLLVHTAGNGFASFAQGIQDLVDAGADIVVDDIIYLAEAVFQPDIISQKVNEVADGGTLYVSAAGNSAANAYLKQFVEGEVRTVGEFAGHPSFPSAPAFLGGTSHDFADAARGPAAVDDLQRFVLPEGATIPIVFQWSTPFFSISGGAGADTDFDIYVLTDEATPRVVGGATTDNLATGDGFEVFFFENPAGSGLTTFNFMFVQHAIAARDGENRSAPTPHPHLYNTWFAEPIDQLSIHEHDTQSGTIYGHPNAWGAFAIGAVAYFNTPEFGVSDPVPESYTAVGGVPIVFDAHGNLLPEALVFDKPSWTAPTGGSTTFFGSPDGNGGFSFFGTSAAAPHAAALLALLLVVGCAYAPRQLRKRIPTWVLLIFAFGGYIDMCDVGPDYGTGIGFVDGYETMMNGVDNSISCADFETGDVSEFD